MKTEAQKRASKKWEDKHEMIRFRATKGKKDKLQKIADKENISFNKLMNSIINKEINNSK